MIPSLDTLRAKGVLSPLDVHFARALGRRAGEERDAVLLAAALASHHVSAGHVCLDLEPFARASMPAPLEVGQAGEDFPEASDWQWPAADAWLEQLRGSPIVDASAGRGGAPIGPEVSVAPLVLDASGRLYLRRYWEYQERLASALRRRIADRVPAAEIDEVVLADGLDRFFHATASDAEPDRQRLAAELALRVRFLVVSGGPGTGKTSVVVKILVLLAEQALARGLAIPRMLLTAPTGKAAARLQQAVQHDLASLDCADAVRAALPDTATTIHRCLGPYAGSAGRFRHDADHPLETDGVVVDEASMVDIALMSRLVAAIPDPARLILLGDRDQLASVQAGSVLADISGVDVAHAGADAERASGSVVELVRSHRFGAESGIGALCRAVNAGDTDTALGLLDDPAHADISLDPPGRSGLPSDWMTEVRAGYAPLFAETDPVVRLRALDAFRVLCAHRHGRLGVESLGRAIERLCVQDGLLRAGGSLKDGMPILITRNDYELNLYNGDVGLIVERSEGKVDGPRALFLAPDGEPRWISPLRLRFFETVFAMSIHKSQGSEFESVVVVLPDELSPVLTRELVYTAISRARTRVRIYASRDVLREAIARRVSRSSGLSDALWTTPSPPQTDQRRPYKAE
jgi:exodeoxyribonuclease V alpha subunit